MLPSLMFSTLARRTVSALQGVVLAGCALISPLVFAADVLTVYGLDVPPLIMNGPQGPTGIVADVTVEAFRRAGYTVRIEILPWSRAFAEVQNGRGDALIPTVRSPEREAVVDFTAEPVFRSEQSLFHSVDRRQPWAGKLTELKERKIVMLRGALIAPEFDKAVQAGQLQVQDAADYFAVMRMLDAGRADVAVAPRVIGMRVLELEQLGRRVVPLDPPLSVQPFYIAFAKRAGLSEVRQKVDLQLAAMWKDGSVSAVIEAYRKRQWQAEAKGEPVKSAPKSPAASARP